MKKLTAQEAINKIKSVRATFLGQDVQKYNYASEIRSELQKMAERNEISPIEFKKALDITWTKMLGSEKRGEFEKLNQD